jgi:hypothetical protein
MAEVIEAEEVTPPPPAKKAAAKKAPAKKAPVVEEPEAEVVEEAATIVEPATQRGRVKGTWRMHYAGHSYDFVDGEHYELPQGLYDYLRGMGNIYDTLA